MRKVLFATLIVLAATAIPLASAPVTAVASNSGSGTPAPTPTPSDAAGRPTPSSSTAAPPSPVPPNFTVNTPPDPVSLPQVVGGTRDAGAEIQVQPDDGSGQPLCIAPATQSTSWNCTISALPSGDGIGIRVVAGGADGATADQRIRVSWLNPPTLVAAEKATTAGQVGGAGYPGATVTATVATRSNSCSATVDSSGGWTCVLAEPLASGSYSVTATQSASFFGTSQATAPVTVAIDKDAPNPPTITSPVPGSDLPSRGATVSGTGDDGNSVIVFAGIRTVCQVVVAGGTWSCTAGPVPAGTYDVTALQMDEAGNASAASAAVSLSFSDATAATTPTPSSESTAPGDEPGTGPRPTAPEHGDSSTAPDAAAPPSSSTAIPDWIQSLRRPTTLGTSLASITSIAPPQIAVAATLAAGTVGLVIVPVLLATRGARTRRGRLPSVTGRNRSRGDARATATPLVDRWTRAVVGTAATAALLVLSMPVLAESNYLRLAVGAAIAVAVLNAVGTIGVVRLARGLFGVEVVTVTRLPLVAVAAATAAFSRLFTLAPPVMAGQILGTRFGDSTTPRQRANVSLSQIITVCALTVGGWVCYSILPSTGNTLGLLLSETSGVLTLTAATSAAIAALPLGSLPGTALASWSRAVWVATAVLAWSLLFLVLTAVTPGHAAPAVAAMAAIALGASAVTASIWLWTRFVEPYLRAS